jgi:acetyl-CoA acetyltransferase
MSDTAVAGIGYTNFSKNSGTTVTNLAMEACLAACADAGVPVEEVDGIVMYAMDDSVHPQAVATGLGLPRIGFYTELYGGGQVCCATLGYADMLLKTQRARHVLICRALNGRSGYRLGGTGMEDRYSQAREDWQYTFPSGWVSYPQFIAMAARRHMLKYGTSTDAMAEVALTCRANAQLNERAVMRKPLTIDDYYSSKMVADPLRLYDICLETDGACALLVTTTDEAAGLNHPVVRVLAAEQGGGARIGFGFAGPFSTADLANLFGEHVAPRVFERAGVTPQDIDVAEFYDCFTFSVLAQIEGFGFCDPGESTDFVKDGRIRVNGDFPINTHGGMLSEAYVHGLNGIVELVSQLRGDAGDRQVPDAKVGIATGFGVTSGCAAILARG